MPANPTPGLSANQQAMLDLALACDLKSADPAHHPAMRQRHQAINTQRGAADYLREVENRIHSRRKFPQPVRSVAALVPVTKVPTTARGLTAMQTSLAVLLLTVFMVVAGWSAPAGANLILVTLFMGLTLVVLGISTMKRPLGVLINERNLMSLSRFQMVLWTVIILSSYLTFALARIKMMALGAPIPDPLGIRLDWQLWALMGISTTSLVGAALILNPKTTQEPTPAATAKSARMVNEPEPEILANKRGILYANASLADARMTDMLEGDELINTARIDLAKVQMFYFTIIAAICFFVMTFKMLVTGNPTLDHLPSLPQGFVAILGISHAGYLTSKGITRTQSVT